MRSYISLSLDPVTAKLLQERGAHIKNLSKYVCNLLQVELADKDFLRKQAFANFENAKKNIEQYGFEIILKEKKKAI